MSLIVLFLMKSASVFAVVEIRNRQKKLIAVNEKRYVPMDGFIVRIPIKTASAEKSIRILRAVINGMRKNLNPVLKFKVVASYNV